MILLAEPLLAWAVLVSALPVALHLARRRLAPQQPWAAMPLLRAGLAAYGLRLWCEDAALLALRCGALACLALALTRPSWRSTETGIAGAGREGPVVLLVDDGLSGRVVVDGERDFARLQRLAAAWLDGLEEPSELALVLASRPTEAETGLGRRSAAARLAALRPGLAVGDRRALLTAGQRLLAAQGGEGTLVFLGPARQPLAQPRPIASGRGIALRLLAPAAAPVVDLAVGALDLGPGPAVVGRPLRVVVRLIARGGPAPAAARLRLLADGRVIGDAPVSVLRDGATEVIFTHVFAEAGPHTLEAVLAGVRDQLPEDDRRARTLQVEAGLQVLLVGGDETLAAALADPGDEHLVLARCPATRLGEDLLGGVRLVVLADVTALEPRAVAALERFVVGGGGLLVSSGPQADAEIWNRAWWRRGDGFLPCAVGAPVDLPEPSRPLLAAPEHPGLALLAQAESASAAAPWWSPPAIRRHLPLVLQSGDGCQPLLALARGQPLGVERRRGAGRVVLLGACLGMAWGALAENAGFPILVRQLLVSLAGTGLDERNLRPGGRLWTPAREGLVAVGPDASPLGLTAVPREGSTWLSSQPLDAPGIYTVRSGETSERWALSLPDGAPDLRPADLAEEMQRLLPGASLHRAAAPEEVVSWHLPRRQFALWPWLLLLAATASLADLALIRRRIAARGWREHPVPGHGPEPASIVGRVASGRGRPPGVLNAPGPPPRR